MENQINEVKPVEIKMRRKYRFINRKPRQIKVLDPNRNPVGRPRKEKIPKEKRPVGRPRIPDELKKKYIKKKEPKIKVVKEKKPIGRPSLNLSEEVKKERSKLNIKKWYEKNKTEYIDKLLEKIQCECGAFYTKCHKLRHLRSRLHANRFRNVARENNLDGIVGQDNYYDEIDPELTETESINAL